MQAYFHSSLLCNFLQFLCICFLLGQNKSEIELFGQYCQVLGATGMHYIHTVVYVCLLVFVCLYLPLCIFVQMYFYNIHFI